MKNYICKKNISHLEDHSELWLKIIVALGKYLQHQMLKGRHEKSPNEESPTVGKS